MKKILTLLIISVFTLCAYAEGAQGYQSPITQVGSGMPSALYSTTAPGYSPYGPNKAMGRPKDWGEPGTQDDDGDPEFWNNPGDPSAPIGDIPWIICGLLCGAYIFLSIKKRKHEVQ